MFNGRKIRALKKEISELRGELQTMRYHSTFLMPTVGTGEFDCPKELTFKKALHMIVRHFDLRYKSQSATECLVSGRDKPTKKKTRGE